MHILFYFLISLSLQAFSNETPNNQDASSISLDKVVVFGSVPGPELWKVTNKENVLWILGTLSPLPKKMDWNSEPIELVIKDSQALILPPTVSADIGFFKGLSLATSAIGMKKNPEKQKLHDVMPSDLYSRWLVLKKKYLGNNNRIEKTRPIFAASKLFEKAIKKIGLESEPGITKKVRKFAKRNELELITPTVKIELNKPKAAIKKFKKTKISDLECFSKTLERLEVDLEAMSLRAIAWANGNVDEIRNIGFTDENKSCISAILDSDLAQDVGMTDLPARVKTKWFEEAKKALATHKSSFAILSINNLLSENSYIDLLEAEGYKIVIPK